MPRSLTALYMLLIATLYLMVLLGALTPTHAQQILIDSFEDTQIWTENVVLSDKLVVIDEQSTIDALQAASVAEDTLIFDGTTTQIQTEDVQVGDILMIGVTDKTPYGLLRRVIGIQEVSGQTQVMTESVPLAEIFESGLLTLQTVLQPESTSSPSSRATGRSTDGQYNQYGMRIKYMADGVRFVAPDAVRKKTLTDCSDIGGFYFQLDDVEIVENAIYADGCVSFKSWQFLKKDFGFVNLKYLEYGKNTNVSALLQLRSELVTVQLNPVEKLITSLDLPPIALGPVVIVPEIDVVVGIEGESGIGLSTGISYDYESNMRAIYQDGSWSEEESVERQFDFVPPTISDDHSLIGYVGLEANFLVYGVVGGGSTNHANLELQASFLDSVWQLYGGIRGGLQVRAEVFDKTIAEYAKSDIIGLRVLLASNETWGGSVPLNDTGIDWCADGDTNNLDCPVAGYPGQDGEFGRDAQARAGTLTKVGAGAAGFDYTKLDASGNDLPAGASDWSCVRDNHTGRVWEVKTDDGGLRDKDHEYSWYNPDPNTNGGDAGTQNGGSCTGSACDTRAYVQAVNAQGLCGISDWRMPTRSELMSIVDNGRINPAVDTNYFPNTLSVRFWSSLPDASSGGADAWYVYFGIGSGGNYFKGWRYPIRLVGAERSRSGGTDVTCTNENTAVPATTPTSDFTVLGDGSIVRHEATGLEWQRCALGQSWDGVTCQGTAGTYTWQQALQAAVVRSGWRLPNKNELASIVEDRCYSPTINTTIFPNTLSDWFWSSSPYTDGSFSAWEVDFSYGGVNKLYKSSSYRVRLVRAGQWAGFGDHLEGRSSIVESSIDDSKIEDSRFPGVY